ncbi:MAG: helix-turn-helix domain-containing protein [Treponema sp.]|jgi:transcriptional regulator with XRE-family HTH domain|nr:helix-turn-helix domain-containing protein [Treponema sp.]
MEMMKIFVFNMKKYRKKRLFSQEKLAEMLNTSTSYIGEIEINRKIPSMDMVEKIANALNVEPFRLFLDDKDRNNGVMILAENYIECLSTRERQDLSKRLISLISNDIEQILQPENQP